MFNAHLYLNVFALLVGVCHITVILVYFFGCVGESKAAYISEILNDDKLRTQWLAECKGMADRIITMRAELKKLLHKNGSSRNWEHVKEVWLNPPREHVWLPEKVAIAV